VKLGAVMRISQGGGTAEAMRGQLSTPVPRTASKWAAENRVMPHGSPVPGKFDPQLTPFMIPILHACR
jgi:hypothetical protein